jgi:hypothetical protein
MTEYVESANPAYERKPAQQKDKNRPPEEVIVFRKLIILSTRTSKLNCLHEELSSHKFRRRVI